MPKFLIVACLVFLLSACGQTGPLYLPERGQPKKKHKAASSVVVPVTAPGAAAAPAASPDPAQNPAATSAPAPAAAPVAKP